MSMQDLNVRKIGFERAFEGKNKSTNKKKE